MDTVQRSRGAARTFRDAPRAETRRSAAVRRTRPRARAARAMVAGSHHAGMETSRRRLSSQSPDQRIDPERRISDRAARHRLHAGTEADGVRVRRQRLAGLMITASGQGRRRDKPADLAGLFAGTRSPVAHICAAHGPELTLGRPLLGCWVSLPSVCRYELRWDP